MQGRTVLSEEGKANEKRRQKTGFITSEFSGIRISRTIKKKLDN